MEQIKVTSAYEGLNFVTRGILLLQDRNTSISEIANNFKDTRYCTDKELLHQCLDLEHIFSALEEMKKYHALRITEEEILAFITKLYNYDWCQLNIFESRSHAEKQILKLKEIITEVNSIGNFNNTIKVLFRRLRKFSVFGERTDVAIYLIINMYYYLYYEKILAFYDDVSDKITAITRIEEYIKSL